MKLITEEKAEVNYSQFLEFRAVFNHAIKHQRDADLAIHEEERKKWVEKELEWLEDLLKRHFESSDTKLLSDIAWHIASLREGE